MVTTFLSNLAPQNIVECMTVLSFPKALQSISPSFPLASELKDHLTQIYYVSVQYSCFYLLGNYYKSQSFLSWLPRMDHKGRSRELLCTEMQLASHD